MLLMLSNEVRRPASSVWIQAYSLPAAEVRSSILLTVASTRMPFAAGARAGALDALGAAAVAMALSTPESAADASTWRSSDCWVFCVGAAAAFASSSSSPASMSSAESPYLRKYVTRLPNFCGSPGAGADCVDLIDSPEVWIRMVWTDIVPGKVPVSIGWTTARPCFKSAGRTVSIMPASDAYLL